MTLSEAADLLRRFNGGEYVSLDLVREAVKVSQGAIKAATMDEQEGAAN